jgi:hypothetical protein
MRIYFATWIEQNQGVTLSKKKATNRLISYFFLRDGKNNLHKYIKTGIFIKGETNGI